MAKVEMKSKVFKNFTSEEFVCSWDGTAYRFPAGKEMYVEDWKAEHFAKHLVNHVMHKAGMITTNMIERQKFLDQAMPKEEEISQDEAIDLNARAEVKEKKASKIKKVETEEEFSGLNEK